MASRVSRQVARADSRQAAKPVIVQHFVPGAIYIDKRRPVPNLHVLDVRMIGAHERSYHATKGYRWRRV